MIRAYCQSAATLPAFVTGGYAAMHRELAHRVDEAPGFMAARLIVDHPIMQTIEFWTSHECLFLPYE
ncbi:hypothetical protein SAY87_020593 [Trapa incisa]|uniref:3-deoxy-7-phosphoheptulonate synthase n=1 Tax=Trapa incisa TaxID=236973 RepID=A0AAN7JQK1_9MYRT|nr:hypothetical protein SAY87_020593 [Trapa incisa]